VDGGEGGYKHFMLKEIHEQPRAVTDTLRGRLELEEASATLEDVTINPKTLKKLYLVACGTSWHAALWASSSSRGSRACRWRSTSAPSSATATAHRQGGPARRHLAERRDADTLAAVKEAKQKGGKVLAIANVVDSSIPRASDYSLYTHAGPEIGVASTKAFTTQLAALTLLAIYLGRRTGALTPRPPGSSSTSSWPSRQDAGGDRRARRRSTCWRGATARPRLPLPRPRHQLPHRLEGALKLKEISYIHAEGTRRAR